VILQGHADETDVDVLILALASCPHQGIHISTIYFFYPVSPGLYATQCICKVRVMYTDAKVVALTYEPDFH
jgi:hypothetical protein